MRAVVQRVRNAGVDVGGVTVGKIGRGFLVLLGVERGDTEADASAMAKKISGLRIFDDAEGKMNLDLKTVGGEMLVISNFTLCAEYSHGNRPSFFDAEEPERADALYRIFMEETEKREIHTEHGVFGAHMEVSLVNDGPITLVIESSKLKK